MRQYFKWIFVGAVTLAIPFIYQNCAPVEPLDEETPSVTDLYDLAINAPFAYEAEIDTVATMSCSGAQKNNAAIPANDATTPFFTFKALASKNNYGIRLSTAFKNYAKSVPAAEMASFLNTSPMNKNSLASLSIRKTNNTLAYSNATGVGHFWTKEPLNFSLTHTDILNVLLPYSKIYSDGPYIREATLNYTVGGSATYSVEPFMAKIDLSKEAHSAYIARDYHMRQQGDHLAMSFSKGGVVANHVEGLVKKFRFIYSRPGTTSASLVTPFPAAPSLQYDPSYTNLSYLEIRDYAGNSSATEDARWDCRQALIVRNIGAEPGSLQTTCGNWTTQAAAPILRAALPANQWIISSNGNCVMPVDTAYNCYKGTTAPVYSGAGTCVDGTCPHFVGVCQRN